MKDREKVYEEVQQIEPFPKIEDKEPSVTRIYLRLGLENKMNSVEEPVYELMLMGLLPNERNPN